MPAYNAIVRETVDYHVTVNADSREDAKEVARSIYRIDHHLAVPIRNELVKLTRNRTCEDVCFAEIVFDLTLYLKEMLPDDVEYDSRELCSLVYSWSTEFDDAYTPDKDYLTEIDEFAKRKYDAWLRGEFV